MLRPVQLLRRATRLIAGVACAASTALYAAVPSATGPDLPLTTVAEVKSWSPLAEQSLAVSIEGVVTCAAPAGNFFLHDGSLGIHVAQSEAGRRLRPGERVRVRGTTRRGAYAPSLQPSDVVSLGPGVLPSPRQASYAGVAEGTLDGQYLAIEGVVCDVGAEPSNPGPILSLATDGRRLRVAAYAAEGVDPEELIDAEVRVRGVATGNFNRQRQLVEPMLRIQGLSAVTVLRAAPADPFAGPVVPLGRLLGFSLDAPSPHRVRIRGVVTRRISDRVLFVRGDDLGLRIETRRAVAFGAGDIVEAVGFPAMAAGAAVLESAVARVIGTGPAPEPVRPPWPALLDGSHTADLVAVQARLVDWVATGESATLILQSGDQLLRGSVRHPAVRDVLPEKGSLVEATGLCATSGFDDRSSETPRALMLLIATPADLTVLQRPDWWTAARLATALAAVLVLLALGLGWVWSLRRQVQQKRAVIEHQARHAAVLEERSRIARDLHDTIEQGLTGLSLQLKVAELDCTEAPERVREDVESARHMLRQSRALAHNAIRELRTDDVAGGNETLAEGLQRTVDLWKQAGLPGVSLVREGEPCALPRATEQHLIRIGTEAVTNAVKHGSASAIAVTLRFGADRVRLQVDDNGTGFDPARAAPAASGHFGIAGMRERAAAAGAELMIQPRAGGGMTVAVEVALDSAAARRKPGTIPRRPAAPAASES